MKLEGEAEGMRKVIPVNFTPKAQPKANQDAPEGELRGFDVARANCEHSLVQFRGRGDD